ncbi:MAG: hypothetical protein ACYS99_15385 [Planctomycetota bacterium]|jgi:hypothetical protein
MRAAYSILAVFMIVAVFCTDVEAQCCNDSNILIGECVTIDYSWFGSTRTYKSIDIEDGETLSVPSNWYDGPKWHGNGEAFCLFFRVNPPAQGACEYDTVEVTRADGSKTTDGYNPRQKRYWAGSTRKGSGRQGIPPSGNGTVTGKVHCPDCPCFCDTLTFTLKKV